VSGVAREIGNDKMTNNLERAWIRDLHLRKAEVGQSGESRLGFDSSNLCFTFLSSMT
jgi:hypothetical protein